MSPLPARPRSPAAPLALALAVFSVACSGDDRTRGGRHATGALDTVDFRDADAADAVDAVDADAADTADDGASAEWGPCTSDEPGCTCRDDADCASGVCVWTSQGQLCSVSCGDDHDCPSAWACTRVGERDVCTPRVPDPCRPCDDDADCAGDRCLPVDGAPVCHAPCGAGLCPDAFDRCNGHDDDCDGASDEDCAPALDAHASGFGNGFALDATSAHRLDGALALPTLTPAASPRYRLEPARALGGPR